VNQTMEMNSNLHRVYRAAWLTGWVLLSLVTARSAEVSPDTAWQAYRRGNFRGSQSQYSQLAKEAPDDPRLRFNAGAAAYRQNDLTNATTWFESVLNAQDLKLQQQAYYNLGNTQFRLGENLPDAQVRKQLWGEALTNFVSAMKLDAADTNAAANYAFVRQQLEQLEQQLPPPQQQQQKKDQKDNQDQKKQDNQQSENGDDNSPQQPPEKDQDQQKQDNPNGGNEKEDQEQSGQPSSEEESKKSEEKKSGDEKKEPSESEGDQSEGGKKEGSNTDANQPGAGQEEAAMAGEQRDGEMSEAQAVQMLEGQKDDEKALLLRAYGNGKEAAERAARIRKPW